MCNCAPGNHKLVKDFLFKGKDDNLLNICQLVLDCPKMRQSNHYKSALRNKFQIFYSRIRFSPEDFTNICNYSLKLFGEHSENCRCLYDYIVKHDYPMLLFFIRDKNVKVQEIDISIVIEQCHEYKYKPNSDWDTNLVKICALLFISQEKLSDRIEIFMKHPVSKLALQDVVYDLTYKRMIEICLAMQNLNLPALVTYKIVKHACRFLCPCAKAKMNDVWKIITKIKHFH